MGEVVLELLLVIEGVVMYLLYFVDDLMIGLLLDMCFIWEWLVGVEL